MSDVTHSRANGARHPAEPGADLVCLFALSATQPAGERRPPEAEFETRLTLLRIGAVTALVGLVPASDYCGVGGDRNMADIAWLAPRIRRHAALMEWAMRESAVFPIPFGTLYVSLQSLTEFIRTHEPEITRFLADVAGKQEWELRAYAQLDGSETLNRMAARQNPEWWDLAPGKRYMRLSRDKPALIEQARGDFDDLARALTDELRPLAAAMRRNAISFRRDDSGAELIARYAFLVRERDVDLFRSCIEQRQHDLAYRDLTLTLSGPWPPFSFRPDLRKGTNAELAGE